MPLEALPLIQPKQNRGCGEIRAMHPNPRLQHIGESSRDPAAMQTPRFHRVIATRNLQAQTVPLINVKLIEGVFSEQQKKQIQRSLTEAMVQIEGEALRPVTWCVVEEVKSGDWAVGGQSLTTADVKAMAARKAA